MWVLARISNLHRIKKLRTKHSGAVGLRNSHVSLKHPDDKGVRLRGGETRRSRKSRAK